MSAETRKIVVETYLSGKATPQQLTDILGFHRPMIVRWVREYKKDGRLKPQTRGHMPRAFSVEESERLAVMVKEKPDLTLEEIREAFSKNCSLVTVHRTLRRLGFRYKKALKVSGQGCGEIAESRKKWAEFQKDVPAERLVFLDESSAKTDMMRLRGRSLGGSCCHVSAPCGHWKTLTMLSSIQHRVRRD